VRRFRRITQHIAEIERHLLPHQDATGIPSGGFASAAVTIITKIPIA